MCNEFYHWELDSVTGFRKLILDYTHTNLEEKFKMRLWSGKTRVCSKCREELPENTYFFASGGKTLHRYCKTCEGSPSYGWGINYNKELNRSGFHYCGKCDRILPLNNLYFTKTNGKCNKTGYSSNCKECNGRESGFGIHNFNSNEEINDIRSNSKVCHSCHLELPNNDNYFFKKKGRENGSTICKLCKGFAYGIERINKVLKEELNEDERFCSVCKNKFNISEMATNSWCRNCRSDKLKEYYLNPETKNRVKISSEKRRKLEKNSPSVITSKDIEFVFNLFNNSCAYCGMTLETHYKLFNQSLHCDHIHPLSKGGYFILGNIIPACRSCNCSKHNRDIFTFYDISEKFTYERLEVVLEYIDTFLNN